MSVRSHPLVAAVLAQFPGADVIDVKVTPEAEADAVYLAPQPGERRQHSLGDIRATLVNEADRIRAAQFALVELKDREAVHAGEMLRAEHFDCAAQLIDRCKASPEIMERLKKGPGA